MRKAQKNRSKLIFDLICALFCVLFLVVQAKNMLFGGTVLALGTVAAIGLGVFLSYYKGLAGTLLLPLCMFLALINLPLIIPAIVLMGGFIYIWAGISLATTLIVRVIWPWWRVIFIGVFTFFALFLATGPLFERGLIGAKSPTAPEIVLKAGGTLSNKSDPQHLSCGIEPGSVIVSYPKQGKIALLDIKRGLRHEIDVAPGQLTALGSGQTMVLAIEGKQGKVYALNARDLSLLHEFSLNEEGCIVGDAELADLYLRSLFVCQSKQSLLFVDTLKGNVAEQASRVGMMPYRIGINNALERGYVTDLIGSQVTEFDLETMSALRTIPVGMCSSDIVTSPKNHRVYVAMPLKGKIRIYDGVTLEKIHDIPAPIGVTKLAIDVEHKRLFAASFATGELIAVNLYSPSSPKKFKLGSQVRDLIFCSAGGYLVYSTPFAVHYLKAEQLFN